MSDPATPPPEPSDPAAKPIGADPAASASPADIADRKAIASDLAYRASRHRPASYEPASLRHIDWASTLPFVHLFKGFRLAVHPSKLLLALAAVLLMYTGGRVLDGLWPNRHQALPGEAAAFGGYVEGNAQPSDFAAWRRDARERSQDRFKAVQQEIAAGQQGVSADAVDLGRVKTYLLDARNNAADQARKAYDAAKQRIEQDPALSGDVKEQRINDAGRSRDEAIRGAYESADQRWREVTQMNGRGLFAEFYDYEVQQLDAVLGSVLSADAGRLLNGLYRLLYVGPLWGFSQHPVYFTLFCLWLLLLAAIFGGAITRIAAVQVARDEKISLRSALRFSSGKFVSFLSAPLIPIIIILVIGLAVATAGLIGNVPWVGEIVLAAGFILALLAGFLMTLVLIGLVGGFGLMYPTIAAEGTDSFDAISRGFSYLYARPWQLLFYALVALVYGTLTYLFVRLFLWLVLLTSHTAAGAFIWRSAAGERDLLDALWPAPPSFQTLSYNVPFINLTGTQDIAAAILAFWVYLIVALAPAYAVSLFFSLATIIYFLMRREVDATELDEVYLDPHDEEFAGYADVPDADTDAPVEPPEPGAERVASSD